MVWLLVLLVVILLFGFVVLFGAPYLPTLKNSQTQALALLDLKPGQVLLELGSGDGRVLKAAAQRGIRAIGYELNPLLVLYSKLVCWRYRHLVQIRWRNYWSIRLPACDGIYVFLLERYMERLHKKITQEISTSVKVVSFAFPIKDKKPITEVNGLFYYKYHNKKTS